MSKLIKLSAEIDHECDVIFVHGLNGDERTTWIQSGKVEESWLSWLSRDLPSLGVWTLGYDNKAMSLKGNTIPLQDRATNVLELLLSNGIGVRPLVFVCHSYGGLLIKQLLRSAHDSGHLDKSSLLQHTQGVIFLATPHSGSEKASWFVHYASILWPSVTIAELQAHNAQLRDMNLWYRNNAPQLEIQTAVIYETKKTAGLRIVDETSSDPGMPGVVPIPVDCDHTQICKPVTIESEVYLHVRRLLRSWLSSDISQRAREPRFIATIGFASEVTLAAPLRKLVQAVATSAFPGSDAPFPEGSLLEGTNDGMFFAIKKPSVALRGAIEFMQGWHTLVQKGNPDCRTIIGEANVSAVQKWQFSDIDLTSVDQLSIGGIFVSEAVADAADPTMATFSFVKYTTKTGRPLFRAIFEDPRTVKDSSLIHAFFVAHPAAQHVRKRLIELFLLEYVFEYGSIDSLDTVKDWLHTRNYPAFSEQAIADVLQSSEYLQKLESDSGGQYTLLDSARKDIEDQRRVYSESHRDCVALVRKSLDEGTSSEDAAKLVDLEELIEEYLSALFFEVRLMANYLRRTDQVFESSTQTLRKFDYIITRRLRGLSQSATETWRSCFVRGLKRSAEANNAYVATIFHNVLATYYLNRSPRAARYQRERLTGRTLYIDTNVLYAARVGASNFHESIRYLIDQLRELGFSIRVFPFSIREYEKSLRNVDNAIRDGVPEPWVVETNPWIFQEFKTNQEAYLTFSACRRAHSISKQEQFTERDFDRIDAELARLGIAIEREVETLEHDEVSKRWTDLISKMQSSSWDLDRWWEFRYSAMAKADKVVEHDVLFLHNVEMQARKVGEDEFGPRALLLTLDAEHLLRLRRTYKFIVGIRQCQEYFLPYLFLNDVPIKQSVEFPNQLLSRQLGTLLMKYRPTALDVVESALRSEKPLQLLESTSLISPYRDIAGSFNHERLRDTVTQAIQHPEQTPAIAAGLAELFEFGRRESLNKELALRARDEEIARLRVDLEKEKQLSSKQGKALEKQIRTNRYIRSQSRRKGK